MLSSEFARQGDSVTPSAPLSRREARALQSAAQLPSGDVVAVASPRLTPDPASIDPAGTDPLPFLSSEPKFAYTPGPVVQHTSRRATRPIGKNGKRLTDRQIARQLKASSAKGRATNTRPRNHRGRPKPRIGQRLLSLGAMLFAGALLVGMSVPANAFLPETIAAPGVEKQDGAITSQSLRVAADVAAAAASRDPYNVLSWAQVLTLEHTTSSFDYIPGTGSVRWPFPFASPISDGYGERAAPCDGCGTFHNGVDFTPGGGSPIYAIADGLVTYSEVSDYGYGNHVRIVSTINGDQVEALYAHMQMNSSPLKVGDTVAVGDFIGLVGSTGTSTGSHLHFEIKLNGVNVDPFAYLQSVAN